MLADHDVRTTVLHRLVAIQRRDRRLVVRLQVEGAKAVAERVVDSVVIEHGTQPITDLFDALVSRSVNLGRIDVPSLLRLREQKATPNEGGEFALYRVGDAVASRNVHAAVLDSYRLCSAI
jgi:N-methyl-L-proline demethylase